MHFADLYPTLAHSPYNEVLRVVDSAVRPSTMEPRRTMVCIYGAGRGRHEAPLDDPQWEVWALNLVPPLDRQGRLRADVWFDLHQRHAQTADDLRWLRMCPFPLYVPPDLEGVSPQTVPFPLADIERRYGGYWACTFAYQIALALHLDCFTDIGLYGVELCYGTRRERTVEWANTCYWLGRAEERGLTIHLPSNSSLGSHVARYGFEYDKERDGVLKYTRDADWPGPEPTVDTAGSLVLNAEGKFSGDVENVEEV